MMDETAQPPERDQSHAREPANPSGTKHRLTTVDPATGQPGRAYEGHTREDALVIARDVRRAFEEWRHTSFGDRAGLMKRAAAVLRRRQGEFAEIMTAEMGKILKDGRAEIEKCAFNCDHYAKNAHTYLAREPVDLGGPRAFVTFNPLGVVLAVMPWNFPFWQVFRFAAPALMAGNGAVLKHASNVPGCALAIESVFREAGFPENLFRTLLIPSRDVQALIEDPAIAAVTLTGSVGAGRQVAGAAGAALKKMRARTRRLATLTSSSRTPISSKRLGSCAAARMVNAGQSCIAGKRFIVVSRCAKPLSGRSTAAMRSYALGDPRDEATKLGPLQSVTARDEIHESGLQKRRTRRTPAHWWRDAGPAGAWYPATVLTDVRPGMPAYNEEVFGPVAAIIEAADEADAIRIANTSRFGLGSGVLTRDLMRGERIAAEELEAGMSFVNANVRSDPRMPFGGVKESGYGRECRATASASSST